jgi:hypothetical protein
MGEVILMKLYYNIILIILASFIMVMGLVSGATLGNFGQNKCVNLKQTCDNCTYVNITSITAKTNEGASVTLLTNVAMTKNNVEYNYTFCGTGYIGEYTYITVGDPDGSTATESVTFNIGVNNVILYVIIFGVIYLIGFFGFFGKNIWVSLLGGMGMMALGIFTMINGIADYRIFITNVISLTTIGIGAIFALTSGVELIKEIY